MANKRAGWITRIVQAMGGAGREDQDRSENRNREPDSVSVTGGTTPYDELIVSVRAAAHRYVYEKVLPICASDEVWRVNELVLTANSTGKYEFLHELEQQRPGPKLVRWFLERVESPDNHFILDHLQSIRIKSNQSSDGAIADPYEQALRGGTTITRPALEVAFVGEWIDRSDLPRPPRQEAPIQLIIEDAKGLRVIDKPQLPATLGCGEGVDIRVDGRYVSETHAQLSWRGGGCIFVDLRSTNHTYQGDERLSAEREYPIESKMRLRMGAPDDSPAPLDDCPRLIIEAFAPHQFNPGRKAGRATPVRETATPVRTTDSALKPQWIARLGVRDADGEREIGITAAPFYIGRSQIRAGDVHGYVAPQANEAVSGKHMTIHECTEHGVIVKENVGRNGTWLNGERMQSNFTWRWGDTLILGGASIRDPYRPVEMMLLKPGDS